MQGYGWAMCASDGSAMSGRQAYVEAVESLRAPVSPPAGDAGRSTVDRAVGLLAGRTRCRLAEAHQHLLRMAADQNRDVVAVAAGLISLFDVPEPIDDRGPARPAVALPGARPAGPWLGAVQAVLDLLPGRAALLDPVRHRSGRLGDLVYAATSPAMAGADGRQGRQLIGSRLAEHVPEIVVAERWAAYERVLATGQPAEIGPFCHGDVRYIARAHRLGSALFMTWSRHEDPAGERDGPAGGLVAAWEDGARRLAEIEQELAEHRRSLDAEHELAARLQQIILPLPDGPVELPGLKVAVRYLPAGQESLVGGDWYHATALRDGSVLLAVGDVAGHGTQAATTMARLRHALHALTVTTTDPAVLLGHLNQLTCDLAEELPETGATAVVARYEPALRRLTWAQAGHPPPLLSRAARTAPLPRPFGPMLGVLENATYECATLDLALGDVLLFYTDGLVEHRQQSLDDGLAAVIRTVDDAVAASPRQPLAELLSRLRQANPDDDTCILAVRLISGDTQDLRPYLR